jgi:hypothetical protein
LYQFLPARRLDFILRQTGRQSRRRRLPAPAVSWLVIALALFPTLPIPQVWRRLHPSTDNTEPAESAFTQARQRLGIGLRADVDVAGADWRNCDSCRGVGHWSTQQHVTNS